jgi:hypothetical protein
MDSRYDKDRQQGSEILVDMMVDVGGKKTDLSISYYPGRVVHEPEKNYFVIEKGQDHDHIVREAVISTHKPKAFDGYAVVNDNSINTGVQEEAQRKVLAAKERGFSFNDVGLFETKKLGIEHYAMTCAVPQQLTLEELRSVLVKDLNDSIGFSISDINRVSGAYYRSSNYQQYLKIRTIGSRVFMEVLSSEGRSEEASKYVTGVIPRMNLKWDPKHAIELEQKEYREERDFQIPEPIKVGAISAFSIISYPFVKIGGSVAKLYHDRSERIKKEREMVIDFLMSRGVPPNQSRGQSCVIQFERDRILEEVTARNPKTQPK